MMVAAIGIMARPAIVAEAARKGRDGGTQQDERTAVRKQVTHHISPFPAREARGLS
jgi:hypothetical protein